MVTLKETVENMRMDFKRRLLLEGIQSGFFNKLLVLLKPSMVGVILYRLSRFFAHHKLGLINKLLAAIQMLYCRWEISPMAEIGPGLVVGSASVGLTSFVIAGRNCTFLGRNTVSLGAMEGIDMNEDKIVIGDDCVFGVGAKVMRAVNIAAGAQVQPNAVVIRTEKNEGSTLAGIPARRRGIETYDEIVNWNPLYSGKIGGANS